MDGHKRNLILFLSFFMLGVSVWNYREDLFALSNPQHGARQQTVSLNSDVEHSKHFVDPTDALAVGQKKIDISKIPVLDLNKVSRFKPESTDGHEFFYNYLLDAIGLDSLESSILSYPEPLRYLAAMYVVEYNVEGEGFDIGYFGNMQAQGIRFAQKGYTLLGFPELAQILKEAETYYLSHKLQYQRDVILGETKDQQWDFIVQKETHTPHNFDDRWGKAFRPEEVYRRRYAYILKHRLSFSPAASVKPAQKDTQP